MNNVISLNREIMNRPKDLLYISQFEELGYKYGYLYKWSVLAKKQGIECIKPYFESGLKLSLSEVLEFDEKRRVKKYGGN